MTNHRYIPLYLLLLFQCMVAQSQSYVELTDATGFEGRLAHQDTLESASTAMKEVFWEHPTVQEKFKVFSGNFYLHQPSTKDGIASAFEELRTIANEQAPYYLLLGKESNKEGMFQRFKVALKLPTAEVSPCLSANWEQLIEQAILEEVNSVYEDLNKRPTSYYKSELAAIHTLKRMLDKLVGCCQQTAFTGEEEICEECIMAEDGMDTNLKQNGFLSFTQAKVEIEKLSDQSGFTGAYEKLESDYKITLTTPDEDWNYTDELEQVLLANPDATGQVLYFNEENCNAFESVFGSFDRSGGSTLRSQNLDLEVQVVILDFEEIQKVYFKLKETEKSALALNWVLKTLAVERRGGLEYVGTAITLEKCFLEDINQDDPLEVYLQSKAFPKAMDYARVGLDNGGEAQERFGADRPIALEAVKEILSKTNPSDIDMGRVMEIMNEFGLDKAIELGMGSVTIKSLFKFIEQNYTDQEAAEIEAAILACLYGVEAIDKWKEQFVLELLRGYWCANTSNPRNFNFPFIYTGSFSYSDYNPFNNEAAEEVLDGIEIIRLEASGSNTKQGIHVLNLEIEVDDKYKETLAGSAPVTKYYDKITLKSSDGFQLIIFVADGDGMALEKKFKDTTPDVDYVQELATLKQAIANDNRDAAKKILSIASTCLYERISNSDRIKLINWCLDSWRTNPPEEVIIVRLLETVPEGQVTTFIQQFESSINITKLFDAIDNMGTKKSLVKSLIELSNKNILATGIDKIQHYFDFYEEAFEQLNYRVEGKEIVIISTSEYPGSEDYPIYIDTEVTRFAYFAPIAINFKSPIPDEIVSKGLELKGVPGLVAAYYIQKDNEHERDEELSIALTITLGALGVGEVAFAIQAFNAGRTALTAFRVALAVTDLLVFSTDTYCQGRETDFCKDWKEVSFYVNIGLITTSVGDLSISLFRRAKLIEKFADYPNVQKWVEESNLSKELLDELDKLKNDPDVLVDLDHYLKDQQFYSYLNQNSNEIKTMINSENRRGYLAYLGHLGTDLESFYYVFRNWSFGSNNWSWIPYFDNLKNKFPVNLSSHQQLSYEEILEQVLTQSKYNNLNKVDAYMLFSYTTGFYFKKMNRWLRKSINLEQIDEIKNLLTSALLKLESIPENIQCYRALKITDEIELNTFIARHQKGIQRNEPIAYNEFLSIATKKEDSFIGREGYNINLYIETSLNSKCKNIHDFAWGKYHYESQSEGLFLNGTEFNVIEIVPNGGSSYDIYLKEL